MTAPVTLDGGTPVGLMEALRELEGRAVLCLRLWFDGPESQARVWNALAIALGAAEARPALKAFEQLGELILRRGHRTLMRHQVACRCVGADEATFAAFVAAAANDAREDAMRFAALLVRPDAVLSAVELAERFGRALCRAPLEAPRDPFPRPVTLH